MAPWVSGWCADSWMGGFPMMLPMILVWGLILYAVFLGIRRCSNDRCFTVREDNAITILRTRYAKGEITRDEFEEMKKILL